MTHVYVTLRSSLQWLEKMTAASIPFRLLLLVICTLLVFARIPDAFLSPQLLLEDGTVFFSEAIQDGFATLFRPYNGYLVLFPRVIAVTATLLPVAVVPMFFSYSAILALIFILNYLLSCRTRLSGKWLLALLVVAAPCEPRWSFASPTLLHFSFCLLLVLLAISQPSSRIISVLEACLTFFLGLFGPWAVMLLPVFIARVAASRSRHSAVILAGALAAALVQIYFLWGGYFDRGAGTLNIYDPAWLDFLGLLIARPFLYGFGWNSTILVSVVALLFFAYSLELSDSWARRDSDCLCLLGSVMLVLTVVIWSCRGAPGTLIGHVPRYAFPVTVISLWGFAQIMYRADSTLVRLFMGSILLSSVSTASHQFFAFPIDKHSWQEESRCIGGPLPCTVPVAGGWFIRYAPPAIRR